MIAWLLAVAWAGSLDLVEVGGMWSSVTADEPTALWWNPAALSRGKGTRLLIEGAPVVAKVSFEREHPTWGGTQEYRYFGVAPFAGVVSDLNVPGLGVGAGLFVPSARGAKAVDPTGPGRTHNRTGDIQSIHGAIGASYRYKDLFSLGARISYVYGSWSADLDTEYVTALADELVLANGGTATDYYPDDSIIEDPRYQTAASFGPLSAHSVTFGVGAHVTPHPMLDIGVAYNHGYKAVHQGTARLEFDCPPSTDELGRFGAEDRGLCNADVDVNSATVTYSYPSRLHFGVAVTPIPILRLEVFGNYVFWSSFTDFRIQLDGVESANTVMEEDTSSKLEQDRLWARGNRNSFYVALDGKVQVGRFLLGLRGAFDRAAVPDELLSPNNYDANTVQVGALVTARVYGPLEIGLSFTEHISLERSNDSSVFGVTMDPGARGPDRFFYPSMTGTYRSSIHRFGLTVRARFGPRAQPAPTDAGSSPEVPG